MKHPNDDLTALVDGALSEERAAEIEVHLAQCAECRAERDRLLAGLAALAALPPAPVPSPWFSARLQARLAAEGRAPGLLARLAATRWRFAAPAAAALAAAAVAMVAVRHDRARDAAMAENLDLLLDYEVVASIGDVASEEDAAVVAHLDEIGSTP